MERKGRAPNYGGGARTTKYGWRAAQGCVAANLEGFRLFSSLVAIEPLPAVLLLGNKDWCARDNRFDDGSGSSS